MSQCEWRQRGSVQRGMMWGNEEALLSLTNKIRAVRPSRKSSDSHTTGGKEPRSLRWMAISLWGQDRLDLVSVSFEVHVGDAQWYAREGENT